MLSMFIKLILWSSFRMKSTAWICLFIFEVWPLLFELLRLIEEIDDRWLILSVSNIPADTYRNRFKIEIWRKSLYLHEIINREMKNEWITIDWKQEKEKNAHSTYRILFNKWFIKCEKSLLKDFHRMLENLYVLCYLNKFYPTG